MALVLNIETATTVCSVALADDGKVIAHKELDNGFTHAENLHLFIRDILKEASVEPKQLSAIAVSKGPGSYTGLRIGVSTAKGLAYALQLPLISVGTLQVMSHRALELINDKTAFLCPMIDARRMEVYSAVYNAALSEQLAVEALIVDDNAIQKFKNYPAIYFFGDGMPKCKALLQGLPNAQFVEGVMPSATHMCELTYQKFKQQQFEDLAYFEPFYLKDFLITSKKQS